MAAKKRLDSQQSLPLYFQNHKKRFKRVTHRGRLALLGKLKHRMGSIMSMLSLAAIMTRSTAYFQPYSVRFSPTLMSSVRGLRSRSTPTASQLDDINTSNYFQQPPSRRSSSFAGGSLDQKKKVIFILGGPGAGKGTQCDKISREFGIVHLSAGDLLRKERASGSENGRLIDSLIDEGQIVPVAITLGLLRQAMAASPSSRFLIDGFPRNWDNVQGWNEHMLDSCTVESVWFIDCNEQELERRLLQRGLTSGRNDDNLLAARKRFVTYRESTLPIVEHYSAQGKVVSVSGDQPVEDVYRELKSSLVLDLEKDVLQCNHGLLEALAARDWAAYREFCHESLTAFESRADGALIEGLEYHEFGFSHDQSEVTAEKGKEQSSTIVSGPHVRVMGQTAVVSYTRETLGPGGQQVQVLEETRVWRTFRGRWLQVHYHSTPLGAR